MQKVKLPLKVDPVRAAQKKLDYDGIIKAELLERLAESTQSVTRDANVTLSFDLDQRHIAFMRGRADVEVMLTCQRCQEEFKHEYSVEFCYSPLLNREGADDLPEAYEPADVDENGEINLIQIVEDELILELPQVAMHDEADCKASGNMTFGEIPVADERPNPFAVLKNLK
ncbi:MULTISPECIES: 23S rRNA accumulation protein YceD [Photobacterium]|uniref:Large ribosomal RNA subunit accumulation protein YceD n=1 Tax=Photobacterium ganghwense TaxID=320778 RepID=A0A0J1HIJ1_9GAMM|nr:MULTISPECIES: 23S rRNA accumulation protein YceD [Photobacterium]KLV11436.1 ribosomal protein L32p [Photobacterium ganghwense]MBV1841709.1 23S rRNA accumulation protein YceD [Photobacterium ganghwense]PSU08290.1 23S rRNA accumulation protein YceD [Photobacterium ganghwense]QSV15098.1 23S rRNA accumulation protein YceD [Photobacterium ganghwense]